MKIPATSTRGLTAHS